MQPAAVWLTILLALTHATGGPGVAFAESGCEARQIEVATLREVLAGIGGYDTTTTTNQSRFVAEFLLRLAEHPDAKSASGRFAIRPERFIEAWTDATGTSRDDVPETMARVLDYGQRFVVDVSPAARVDADGASPRRTLAVRVSWPAGESSASHYTFVDTLSDPEVRVRHDRVIRYLLMDFGDWIAFEHIEGVSVRPTSGARASFSGLFGMADIRSTRLAVASDGHQVLRTEARKLFRFTHLSTIAPDGTAERDVPRARDDLKELAGRLAVDIDIEAPDRVLEPCR